MAATEHQRPVVLVLTADALNVDLSVLEPIRARANVAIAADPDTLKREIVDADILFVWDFRFADLDLVLPSARRLRWIHAAAVGVDSLITPNLTKQGIILTNSRGVFDRAMAEYVLGLYLMHLKGFRATLDRQLERNWEHRLTRRLAGTTAVVVGTGSIGREIARLLISVGVNVDLVGRQPTQLPEFGVIRPSSELADIVAGHCLVVLAAPLTAHSRHLVDHAVLEAMDDDCYLINVGRGALIDEDALTDALSRGAIGGAALDVFEQEPLPAASALWSDPRTVVSPHMSADFEGFDVALAEVFTENLDRWIADDPLRGIVDLNLGYVPSSTK